MKDLKKEIKYLDGLSDCCGARVFLRTKSKYKLCEKCGVHCRITLSQPEKKEEYYKCSKCGKLQPIDTAKKDWIFNEGLPPGDQLLVPLDDFIQWYKQKLALERERTLEEVENIIKTTSNSTEHKQTKLAYQYLLIELSKITKRGK